MGFASTVIDKIIIIFSFCYTTSVNYWYLFEDCYKQLNNVKVSDKLAVDFSTLDISVGDTVATLKEKMTDLIKATDENVEKVEFSAANSTGLAALAYDPAAPGFNIKVTMKEPEPPEKTGGARTLQIGDTSDSFNQMKVSIGDTDVASEMISYVKNNFWCSLPRPCWPRPISCPRACSSCWVKSSLKAATGGPLVSGRRPQPNRSPAKRVRFGEEMQRSERALAGCE